MSLRRDLADRLRGRVALMGVGNRMRGDDGAGSLVIERLQRKTAAVLIDAEDVPESFLGPVARAQPDTVALIDAVDMGAEPGSVALLDRSAASSYWPSTHRLPLKLAMEYLERETKASVFLIAVQPQQIAFGAPVSERVLASVELLVDLLTEILPPGRCFDPASFTRAGREAVS